MYEASTGRGNKSQPWLKIVCVWGGGDRSAEKCRDGGSGHQEEALHVVRSDAVNVAQHRAVQDAADPLPLLLQPWQNQSLNHLLER